MIFIILFLLGALALTALVGLAAGFTLWLLPVFIVGFLLMHVVYLFIWYLGALPSDVTKPIDRQQPWSVAACTWSAAILVMYGGWDVRITGEEKLPRERRFLYVSNHRSLFDPLMVMDKLREHNISFISKDSNFSIPMVGPIAHRAGYLAIDRSHDRKALRTILTAAGYLKNDICSVGIYPEGTRTRTGELLPFHAGSFKIAQRAGAPLVIACVQGSESFKKHPLRRRKLARIDILECLEPEQVRAMSTQELSEYTRRAIAAHLAQDETGEGESV